MNLCNAREIQLLLEQHGFRFSKSMGQNFLIEDWVPREIAAACGADQTCGVVEIGPGIGPLTAQLAQRAGKVAAIELDRKLLPILAETLSPYGNVELIPGDIMKLDLNRLLADRLPGLTPMVCANLPYNITTPVLTRLVESGHFTAITVMIQREAARRVCAAPGSTDYGVLSVLCQYYYHTELLFEVPPDCFLPAPKVTSTVVRMSARKTPVQTQVDDAFFFRVVRAAFALRRKTLLNSLTGAFPLGKDALHQAICSAGLPETVRGEKLTLDQFTALASVLHNLMC